MNANRVIYVTCALLLLLTSVPGFAVNKEIVQLQTQVQQLDDQIGRMQESFYENMGVLSDLVGQQTDAINQINTNFQNFQKSLTGQSASFGQRNDKVSRQVQALNDSLVEAQAKLAEFSAQLDQFVNRA
jgi:methyl-accepting chemotaxis protein